MPLTFVQQLESVARRAQRRRWATVLCWAFAMVISVLLTLSAVDWMLGVYSPGGRIVLSAVLVSALAAAFAWGRVATRAVVKPLDVALRLERSHPQYRSLLSSGLEFTDQEGDDPTAGSMELRRAVVLRASLAAETIDLQSAVPRKPLRRAAMAAFAAALMLAIPAALAPHGVATGVARLFNPLSDAQWPRRHDLSFDSLPAMVPIGGDFQTTLRDRRGNLPAEVEVEYRTRSQGRWQYHSQTYAASGEAIEIRWPNVQQSFEFRARGGDHRSMPWQRVDAAPAPQIASLDVVVHPPAYTGRTVEASQPPLRILAGSSLELRAVASLPIQSAALRAVGDETVPLTVGSDGRTVSTSTPWSPEQSAEWSFVLTTPDGLVATADRRLPVDVVPDEPPTIELTAPREDLHVVPTATIEVAAIARDDLGVESISLALTPSAGGKRPSSSADLRHEEPGQSAREAGISHTFEFVGAKPAIGSSWQLIARARDSAGQAANSPRPLTVRVISPEEFARRLESLQARLVAALERARAQEEAARETTASWLSITESTQIAALAAAAIGHQQAVTSALTAGSESALHLADSLAAEHRRNSHSDDKNRTDVERWQAEIHAIADSRLPSLESQVSMLVRNAGGAGSPIAPATGEDASLTAIQNDQDAVLLELERLVGELSSRTEVQRHQRRLAELKAEQTALQKETQVMAGDKLRDPDKEESRDQRRRRDQLAARQRELASRLATAVSEMRTAAESLSTQQPREAADLAAAANAAAQSPLQSAARAAADDIAAERLGQAAQNQRQTVEQLDKVIAQLEKSRQESLQSKRQIDELDRELTHLVAEQEAIVADAGKIEHKIVSAELAKRQAGVRQRALAQTDAIAGFPVFAHALQTAAGTMAQVETSLQEDAAAEDVIPLATQALDQLQLLATAVRQQREQQTQPPKSNPPPDDPNANPQEQPSQPPDPEAVQALQVAVAQLGLLRTMQVALQERTAELEKSHAAARIDDAALAERSAELAEEQQKLNELAAELVKTATAQ